MSGGAGPSKKKKIYHFHTEWEEDFFFTMTFSKCVCLVCQSTVAIPKKGNVERHFRTLHGTYDTEFPPKCELRKTGEGAKISVIGTAVIFHTSYF